MEKILILYASSTGNTEEIGRLLQEALIQKNLPATLKNLEMDEMDVQQLLDFDGILFGTYTYDDGDLPFETEVFSDQLETMDLSGKIVGIFGSGDTAYFLFCQAVDEMKERFEKANATVIEHTVKIDLNPDEAEDFASIKKLADQFQKMLHEKNQETGGWKK